MFDIPWADAGFTLDRRAMREWWPRLLQLRYPQYYAIPDNRLHNFARPPNQLMHFLRRVQGTGLTRSPSHITAAGTSGFGALHLAYLKGAKKIVLFGFDYGPGHQGWHHNEGHYGFRQEQDRVKWRGWAENFDNTLTVLAASGVEVINASPGSTISAFPKCTIQEAMTL
jgi:hypothetical protein